MTEEELLKAIREASTLTGDKNAMTTEEMCEATGMSVKVVRRRIKNLMKLGKIEPTWVYRDNITTALTGRQQRVPGYRPKPASPQV